MNKVLKRGTLAVSVGACGHFNPKRLCCCSSACGLLYILTLHPPLFSLYLALYRLVPSRTPARISFLVPTEFPSVARFCLPLSTPSPFIITFSFKVLCGEEGRPSRRRQYPDECALYGCSDLAQGHLQGMLTSFVFGFDSDLIMRALLRLVCDEQPAWLLLPLQSMLSRLTIEHGQVLFYILVPLAVSTALAMNGPCLLPSPPPSH